MSNDSGGLGLLIVILLVLTYGITPLQKLYRRFFPKLTGYDLKSPEEMAKIRAIQLFNISDIKREYQALGMIESYARDKDEAKLKLQERALKSGADAVINVTTNIDNDVSGNVSSIAGMPSMVSGKTSTTTTYHYEGTAVKLVTKA